jgi:glycerol uptake facilitator protein
VKPSVLGNPLQGRPSSDQNRKEGSVTRPDPAHPASPRPAHRTLLGEVVAEFAGTAVLILFGVGVVAQVVTSEGALGDHDSIAWAWGLGVVFGIYTAARISGAHLNPAVTLALAVFKGFAWHKVVPFMLAQLTGAFTAALVIRYAYADALRAVDPDLTIATQGVFSTLPGNGAMDISIQTAFVDQVIGTAILLFLVLAVTDARNNAPAAWLAPFIVGLIVVAIGMAWGTNAGYAINPARDFGPRLASFLTGYETGFQDQHGALYFWVPIVGPLVGGLLGAGAYKNLIERFLPAVEDEAEVGEIPAADPRPRTATPAAV